MEEYYDNLNDLEHEYNVKSHFGEDVFLVTNSDISEKEVYEKVITKLRLDNVLFVDLALIGDGRKMDPSMIGLYGRTSQGFDLTEFWNEVEKHREK